MVGEGYRDVDGHEIVAGDGLWRREEDIYNPLRFVAATRKWCRKAQELGTLPDEAEQWMHQVGQAK